MGFLVKTQETPKEPLAPAPQGRVRRLFFSALVFGTIVSVIVGGGFFAFQKAWVKVKGMEDFRVDPSTLEIKGLPEWVSPKMSEEIKKCSSLRGEVSMFEPHMAERMAREYAKSPWVSNVRYIRKEFPNRLSIQFELRRPVALVKSNGKTYMLDGEGVVLSPMLYQWPKDFPAGPPIIPAPTVPMPAPGQRCTDPGVLAGIDLLFFLMRNRADKIVEITAIDVANVGGRVSKKEPEIVLWTESQVRIKWGRPPSQSDCGEVPPLDKLANLMSVLQNEGKQFHSLDYADVRWDRAYVKYK